MARKPAPRLNAEVWEEAALKLMASQGVTAVAVEPLARVLGVTKGSFYWHFADRDALVTAALRRWRTQSVDDIIARLELVEDLPERLRGLVSLALHEPQHGRIELALAASLDDAIVSRAFAPAFDRRQAFLFEMFRALGLAPASARRRSQIAYALFAGLYQLFRVAPSGREENIDALVDELVASLLVGTRRKR